ncbi:MAG: hypothetical protein JW808_02345, partial [Victivallales bacterium]|nr:hypothetical protein [Victivallales bacterium]
TLPRASGGALVEAARKGAIKETPPSAPNVPRPQKAAGISIFEEGKGKVMELPKLSLDIVEDSGKRPVIPVASDSVARSAEGRATLSSLSLREDSGKSAAEVQEVLPKKETAVPAAKFPPLQPAGGKTAANRALIVSLIAVIALLATAVVYLLLRLSSAPPAPLPPSPRHRPPVPEPRPEKVFDPGGSDLPPLPRVDREMPERIPPHEPAVPGKPDMAPSETTEDAPPKPEPAKAVEPVPGKVPETVEEKVEPHHGQLPPVSSLWLPYQRALADKKGDSFDVFVPGLVVRKGYSIVLAEGVLEKLRRGSFDEAVKKEGDTLKVYAEKVHGINKDVFAVCEFRISPSPGGSTLSVKLLNEPNSPIDVSRDIAALTVDGRGYPLLYGGDVELDPGTGKADTKALRDKFIILFDYEFSEDDRLAGIASSCSGENARFELIPKCPGLLEGVAPAVSETGVRTVLNIAEHVDPVAKAYKEFKTAKDMELKSSGDKLAEKIRRRLHVGKKSNDQILSELGYFRKNLKNLADSRDPGEKPMPLREIDSNINNIKITLAELEKIKTKNQKHKKDMAASLEQIKEELDKIREIASSGRAADASAYKRPDIRGVKKPSEKLPKGDIKDDELEDTKKSLWQVYNYYRGLKVAELYKSVGESIPAEDIMAMADSYMALRNSLRTGLLELFILSLKDNQELKASVEKTAREALEGFRLEFKSKESGKIVKTVKFER